MPVLSCPPPPPQNLPDHQTYAEIMVHLSAQGGTTEKNQLSSIRFLLKHTFWPPSMPVVRRNVIEFFGAHGAAKLGVSKSTFNTHKSQILAALPKEVVYAKRSIKSTAPVYKRIYDACPHRIEGGPRSVVGTFVIYLEDHAVSPSDVTEATLNAYKNYRLAVSPKAVKTIDKMVRFIRRTWHSLAGREDLADIKMGTWPVAPTLDPRKFNVDSELFTSLLREFDERMLPWARGDMSRFGETFPEAVERLDAATMDSSSVENPKKALWQKKNRDKKSKAAEPSSRSDAWLQSAGFLTGNDRWGSGRANTARDQLLTCAKAIFAEDGYLIETLEEFCDPEIVEATSKIIERKNMKEGDESSYIHTILQLHKKVASQFLCLPREALDQLGCISAKYPAPPPGIRPKNKRKLKRFTPDKIREFLTLSDTLIQEVNVVFKAKRKLILAATGKRPSLESLLDPDIVRKIMLASAHDIMLARAPRIANFRAIELDWLSRPDQETTISVPAVLVKKRNRNDPDLNILLSAEKSDRLWTFIHQIRPHILLPGDHDNQKLFPCVHPRVKEKNRSYDNLLPGLCTEILNRFGLELNPHLYRHLIGWIWLKDDPNRLPEVQKMLGHKQLATTLASYAELDETGVLQRWNDHLAKKKTDK